MVGRRRTLSVVNGSVGRGRCGSVFEPRNNAAISGLIWTNLSIPELDRVFNFQLIYGVGIRVAPSRGPGLIVEFRSHHISNAGTAGENLGVNAATVLTGVQWVLR